MARRTLLLIASILVAALGTALIWLYVQGADSRAKEGQSLVQALFLTTALPAGTPGQDAVGAATAKGVPTDVAPADIVTSAAQVNGLRLKDDAVAGQILLTSMFTEGTPSGATQGRGFVSITITDPHRVPVQLRAGQQVAVYALGKGRPRLVVDKITVASIGASSTATTPAAGGTAVPQTIVAFDAAPDEAVRLLAIEPSGEQPALYLLGPGTVATP